MSPVFDPKWISGGDSSGSPHHIRLLGFDHQKLMNGQTFSILRILALASKKAVILTLLLDGLNKTIKKLICRSEIRKHNIQSYINNVVRMEEQNSHVVIMDKYVALYEQATLQFKDQNGNPRYTTSIYFLTSHHYLISYLPGPSLTIWDRNGDFKEKIDLNFPAQDMGLTLSLKRLPGKRFALVQTRSLG